MTQAEGRCDNLNHTIIRSDRETQSTMVNYGNNKVDRFEMLSRHYQRVLEEANESSSDSSIFSDNTVCLDDELAEAERLTENATETIDPVTSQSKSNSKGEIIGFCGWLSYLEPRTYHEAMARDDKIMWQEAINDEIKSLVANNTWSQVPNKAETNTLPTSWVFKRKILPDGSLDEHKARLIVRGYAQREGIDYFETYAVVVRHETIGLFIAIVVKLDLSFIQFDRVSQRRTGNINLHRHSRLCYVLPISF